MLFTGVAAYGHLIPLAPFVAAALERGHPTALVTAAEGAAIVADELAPGVEHLPVGLTPAGLAEEYRRRGGSAGSQDPARVIAETFGGVHLDTAAADAVAAARGWGAEVVLSEAYDPVGGWVAAALGLRWFPVELAPVPPRFTALVRAAEHRRYAEHDLRRVRPTGALDPWPAVTGAGRWPRPTDVPVHPFRARPHRRPGPRRTTGPVNRYSSCPRVLVTLGTVFSDHPGTTSIAETLVVDGLEVVVAPAGAGAGANGDRTVSVRYSPFVPLDELLDGVDVVVGSGSAGTMLAALSRGVPLVLWPQGADHATNTDWATRAGVAVGVRTVEEVSDAVRTVLDGTARPRAAALAAAIADAPEPMEILDDVVAPPR
ncbi:nucleotide disphospho-sugar-binding domain-containing protein [Pseudonocardia alni]|uniref:nucleotide disphospho-sugar-binding domain-containing protein n=1 Tax=Pseudonocardia alni TaxID=33907 RepID=UPI003570F884